MSNESQINDYIILGAGPAGLQLGCLFERTGRRYLMLEAGDSPGSFFKTFPRHRQLLSINKPYTGYTDAADDLVNYFNDFSEKFNLKIHYGTRIVRINKQDTFELFDDQGKIYRCRCLVIATGLSKPYIPPIPGIESTENYTDVSVIPEDFTNQKVLIIGKGNSAFETADNLIETTSTIHVAGPHSISMAWRTHYVGHLRAVNNNILDTYQLKSQNAILDAYVDNIERRDDGKYLVTARFVRSNEVQKDILYDRVITCTGFRFDNSIFDDTCRPKLVLKDRFPAQTCEWQATNVEDLYFAGTLMHVRDYRKATSAFIHGFRYNICALHRMLEKKYHNHVWPLRSLNATPDSLMEAVVARVNRTSALWHQFGFLCDVIAISPEKDKARYYEQMPVDYVHEIAFPEHDCYFTITLEYGPDHDKVDPFDLTVERVSQTDVENSLNSQYLHPVVRQFSRSDLISEHHVLENLENEWFHDVHTEPLNEYFETALV